MNEQELIPVAEESLGVFEVIASVARQKMAAQSATSDDALINGNSISGWAVTKGTEVKSPSQISAEVRHGYASLADEPAIARIVVEDEAGSERTLYISRKTSLALGSAATLASYDSPLGGVASRPVGEELEVVIDGQRKTFYVLEKMLFHPKYLPAGDWDSLVNQWQRDGAGSATIDSLRKLLRQAHAEPSMDAFEALIAGASESNAVTEGLAHQTRTAMALRDQPILDKFQDEIFRLPLDSQLIILGPPGTGKTTTLIKRLGQKLNEEALDDNEKRLLGLGSAEGRRRHRLSWLMFTPSDLLRHYLKEAFAREEVPASDDNIKTWDSFRRDLARNVLGILKTSSGGIFTPKDDVVHCTDRVVADPREWFQAVADFHRGRVVERLRDGIALLQSACPEDAKGLVEKLAAAVDRMDEGRLVSAFAEFNGLEKELQPYLESSVAASGKLIKQEGNRLFNGNKQVFDQLGSFLTSLKQEDDEEDDDAQFDDDAAIAPPGTPVAQAINAYNGFLRGLARSRFRKRSLSKTSRAGRIREWLGEQRVPEEAVLTQLGREITWQNGLRRFRNAWRRYVVDVSASYRQFRRQPQYSAFYAERPENPLHIDSIEMDALVLQMLRNAREIMDQPFARGALDKPQFTELARIASQFRNQVLVDEATDFSMLQLAGMEGLTSLRIRSFFACGDFNQRITGVGIRTMDQVHWVSQSLREERINTVYRQSRKLNELAGALLNVSGGDASTLGGLPKDSTHHGQAPVLVENMGSIERTATWLADRIREVEVALGPIPTIAVLVSHEGQVQPMAKALDRALEPYSLQADACEGGKSLGEDTHVRVYDVRHIKGLEFEVVFFVGVDELAEREPDLYQRFLYVGATRAATYLGLACTGRLPAELDPVRPHFTQQWS